MVDLNELSINVFKITNLVCRYADGIHAYLHDGYNMRVSLGNY